MSCVNSFVIRTISCSPAISQFQPNLTTFHSVTFLIFSQLCYFFWHKQIFSTFHSHSNELCRPNFSPSCVDNLNIHALLRGKAFKNINIYKCLFLFYVMLYQCDMDWLKLWLCQITYIFSPLLLSSVYFRHYCPISVWLSWTSACLVSQRCKISSAWGTMKWSDTSVCSFCKDDTHVTLVCTLRRS